MYVEIAKAALQFLQRMSLQGAEVPAYLQVGGMLEGIVSGKLLVCPAPTFEDAHPLPKSTK